ncbi:Glutaredoxin family protein [Perilla frutescens var. frutescens]|nr:Glutaredoxin family protein [Perilla frutescens var. frutescens]
MDKTAKPSLSSYFNRSVTFNSSPAAEGELTNKPLYNLCSTPALQRGGSMKSLYSSPFGSMVSAGNSLKGKVRKLCSIFESPKPPSPPPTPQFSPPSKPSKLLLTAADSSNFPPKSIPSPVADSPFRLPGTEDRVVIYFTSLRGIRKTFHDCHSIRMTFRGFRVNLDERDISMDVAYRKELQRVLGESHISLPQVFIKGKYIGSADVIRQLLEAGELLRLIKGLPLRPANPCDGCDDMRFVPCTNCNGSRKVFDEDDEQRKRCTECNENGLVRCPLCCS